MRLNNIYLSLILFVLAFAVFIPSLNNQFVWDDVSLIKKSSRYFDKLDPRKIFIPRDKEKKAPKYYRPTFQISMYSDYQIWGANPFGYHLTNTLLFSLCVTVLYFFSLLVMREFSLGEPAKYAFITSLVFIVHPMHVESVSWIAGRTDVFCALFFLLAFISHILSDRKKFLVIPTVLLLYLSLISKEVALAFPLVIIAFDLLSGRLKWKKTALYILYICTAILYVYLRSRSYVSVPPLGEAATTDLSADQTVSAVNYLGIVKTFFNSYLFYAYKLVLPFEFNAYIAHIPGGLAYFLSSLIFAFLLLVICVIIYIRGKALIAFSILWVLITLGPSVLVAVFSIAATPLAERYLFIPSIGYCVLTGYLFYIFYEQKKRYKTISMALLPGILIIFLLFNIQRQDVWDNRLALWSDTAVKSSDTAFTHSNYGKALHDEGLYEKAITEYMTALDPEVKDTDRGRAMTSNNLSLVYIEIGEYQKAEYWLEKAREYDEYYLNTYYHLGLINYIRGEVTGSRDGYSKAEEHLRMVLSKSPRHAKARLLLAKVYLSRGKIAEAKKQARKAMKRINDGRLLMEAKKIIEIDNNPGYQQPDDNRGK